MHCGNKISLYKICKSKIFDFIVNKTLDLERHLALYYLHVIEIRNALPIFFAGVLQFLIKCCTLVAPIVVLKGDKLTAPSSFGPP